MMNKKQIEFLSAELVKMTNSIEKLIEDKQALTAGYNREIKDGKKKVKAYCKAIMTDDINKLTEIFGEFELAKIERIGVDEKTT
jgi:hypothetical protein